jgi:hypothetical protein
MKKSKTIQNVVTLTVERHGSGRHTLVERRKGKSKRDPDVGPLFGNDDKGEFYRAVAKEIAKRAKRGEKTTYNDCEDE